MNTSSGSMARRLLDAAERTAELAREASIKKGVRTFVRLNLEQIAALYGVAGSWNAVAVLLTDEGLRWQSGKPVTGHQLRSLYASLRQKRSQRSLQPLGESEPAPRIQRQTVAHLARSGSASPSNAPAGRRRGLADLVD